MPLLLLPDAGGDKIHLLPGQDPFTALHRDPVQAGQLGQQPHHKRPVVSEERARVAGEEQLGQRRVLTQGGQAGDFTWGIGINIRGQLFPALNEWKETNLSVS